MIVGPTASGKTGLAVEEALRVGGEVISADSRQVYRELRIGTARPSEAEMQGVPHHFVGDRSLRAPLSAGQFAREAEARIGDILAQGRVPIVAGGSTLYLKALRDGLAVLPEADPTIRAHLEARLDAEGLPALVAELEQRDPATAVSLDRQNPHRVLRALEVLLVTGTPISVLRARAGAAPRFRYRVMALNPPREALYTRINARVLAMNEAGLREEVQGLLDAGYSPEIAPLRTIGYAEVIAHLQGAFDWPTTLALIQRNTRHYARRQLTFFRKYFGLQ
jgi:tRNA dimethylallyltransferase